MCSLNAPRLCGAVEGFSSFLKSEGPGQNPEICRRKGAPSVSLQNARGRSVTQACATSPLSQACRQKSRRTTKLVLLGYSLVRLVDVLNAILEHFPFCRQ
jgi:hypothetical protein